MAGWLSFILLAWGLRGSIGLSSLPQAVTDSTQEVAFSPFFQISAFELAPGLSLEGSIRGLFQDHTREGRAPWRLITGTLTYRSAIFPLSLRIGRQFSFLHLGGWLDGLEGAVTLKGWELKVLGGKRAPSLYAAQERFLDPDAATLWGLQIRALHLRPFRITLGYGQEKDGRNLRRAPLWSALTYQGSPSLRGELAFDLSQKILSRALLSAFGWWKGAYWSFSYRYTNPWYALNLLGIQEHDPTRLSRPLHRAEGSVRLTHKNTDVTLGTWIALSATQTTPTFWVQFGIGAIRFFGWAGKEPEGWQRGGALHLTYRLNPGFRTWLSGRLVDDTRWPNRWIGSLRLGLRAHLLLGVSLTGEIRLWENPEVDREVQGYLSLVLPFEWRS